LDSEKNLAGCHHERVVHTIGHSTRTLEEFFALLKTHRVDSVIDVRRWPASRRFPHFHREALANSLAEAGIGYVWRGDLGGFRKPAADSLNTAWRVGAFRAYADFMLTDEFRAILPEVEKAAAAGRITLMCAEAVPWRCHRQLLSDSFVVRGWEVRHIMDAGCHEHKLPSFAHVEDGRIQYRE
jgi:uncharacterized protein (DUF488 family)